MSRVLIANKIKSRRGKRRHTHKKRKPSGWFKAMLAAKKNPARKHKRHSSTRTVYIRAKRNPIVPKGFVTNQATPALVGAVGALINDIAIGSIAGRLPVQLQAPELRHLIKAATAVGIGMAVDHFTPLKGATIRKATTGALTCVMHDALRAQVQKMLPTVPMGEYLSEVLGPLQPQMLPYADAGYVGNGGMGEMLNDAGDGDEDPEGIDPDVF